MSLSDSLDQLREFDFNDLDFDRIGTWPLAGRIFMWVLAFVVILFGFYMLKAKDLNAELARQEASERQLRQSFNKKAHEAANLETYRVQMQEMQASFGAMLSQLPKESEVPDLLEDISERGSAAGLRLERIKLEEEVSQEFYVELPIDIEVVGNYHQFGRFVSGVSGLPRIVTLHEYKITKPDSGRSSARNGPLSMTIKAKTYRYKSQDE